MDPTASTDRRDAAVATVTDFFAALDALDVPRAGTFLTPDVVWRNTTLPTLRGLPTVTRALRAAARPRCRFEAVVHHIASDGDAVLVERTDTLTLGPLRSTFWVCGTFEIRDGKIAVWRDYFSWRNVLLGAVTGTLRSVRGRQRHLPAAPGHGRSTGTIPGAAPATVPPDYPRKDQVK